MPALQLEAIYAPIAAQFADVLEQHVQLVTRSSYARFREAMNQGSFDIAFVQPFYYVELADNLGFAPLARQPEDIVAVLITVAGQFNTINELRGTIIAFPPEDAAVTILGKHLLYSLGLEPQLNFQPVFLASHYSCLNHVLIGKAAACITAPIPLTLFMEQSGENLQVLAESQGIPASVLTVSPRVTEDRRRILRKLILSWGETPQGRELLRRGHLAPFVMTVDHDYDAVRQFPHLPKTDH